MHLSDDRGRIAKSHGETSPRQIQSQSVRGALRGTDGFAEQEKLLEPRTESPLKDADGRFVTLKRNLQAELQAERLATIRDMPGQKKPVQPPRKRDGDARRSTSRRSSRASMRPA